ncbi:hypothetical protein JEQ12_015723 [Ovis aries]|uniref:Uncharacterized protein n=1 Tax=Ovis aries TaxID=9940 RepID=A0A836AIF6_SHEEP|nr:hypothetical protein JEQ12_015723 [Ovis aries]
MLASRARKGNRTAPLPPCPGRRFQKASWLTDEVTALADFYFHEKVSYQKPHYSVADMLQYKEYRSLGKLMTWSPSSEAGGHRNGSNYQTIGNLTLKFRKDVGGGVTLCEWVRSRTQPALCEAFLLKSVNGTVCLDT